MRTGLKSELQAGHNDLQPNTRDRMMMRIALVLGALWLSLGSAMAQQSVAVEQDNLMRAQGKSMYGVLGKTIKGEIPYDQKAIDAAIADLEASVPKIPKTFAV